MAEKEHKTLGIKLVTVELTQEMQEALLDKLKGKLDMSIGKYYGEMVRVAIEIGWMIEPKWDLSEVGKQKAMVIKWMGSTLDKIYAEDTTVPPE